ncbi:MULTISPECIES: thermonuclease family protein [unclassified Mesorhizobium]|uniref:thermonuclease family protein n=1 Tax=unclassified Mesorhizobium TaxID=325217 RepID=UPI002477E7A7|nr:MULTISPECIES: thermonuclease family protein [unclassified Mesorhizobium]
MDKYRYDNRSDRWRKRAGAKHSRAHRWANVPRRLILVTAVAAGALVAQTAIQHSESLPEINASNWFGSKPAPIAGVASVIDGDTIEIHGQRIRLNGIDAPESKQYCDDGKGFEYACGRHAAQALHEFLAASRPLHCSFVNRDRYGRLVGDCDRADGRNVQSWLVERGLALDWPRYSHGAYAGQQAKAQAAKGRSVGWGVSGAMGLARRACERHHQAVCKTTTRHDEQWAGGAELFLSAAANLSPDQFVR